MRQKLRLNKNQIIKERIDLTKRVNLYLASTGYAKTLEKICINNSLHQTLKKVMAARPVRGNDG